MREIFRKNSFDKATRKEEDATLSWRLKSKENLGCLQRTTGRTSGGGNRLRASDQQCKPQALFGGSANYSTYGRPHQHHSQ